jgi:outer membrane beta-barrel protein
MRNKIFATGVFAILFLNPILDFSSAYANDDSDDEYNFSWLDPDKKVYVLQNRRYTKARRAQVSVMGGVGLSNPYRTSYSFDPRLAYFFSETLGIEAFYSVVSNKVNNTAQALSRASGTAPLPVIREIKNQVGVLGKWAPWYAKINVFNKILYFDWYFTAGVGRMNMDLTNRSTSGGAITRVNQSKSAFYLGTGHEFHVNEHLDIRWDFMAAFYSSPVFGTTGESATFTDLTFIAGLAWRF